MSRVRSCEPTRIGLGILHAFFLHELSSHISLDYGYNSSVGLCHFGDFHKDMVASVPSGEVYYVGR